MTIEGEFSNSGTGLTVAGAGDVNGDGTRDLLAGAVTNVNGRGSGSVYVIFGKGRRSSVHLADLGSGGFRIDGAAAFDSAASPLLPAMSMGMDSMMY